MSFLDHKQRIVTGLTLVAIILVPLLAGGILLQIFACAIAAIALWEYYAMHVPGTQQLIRKILCLFFGVAIVASYSLSLHWTALFLALAFATTGLCFLFDFGTGNTQASFASQSYLLTGIFYIPLLFLLGLSLSKPEQALVILVAIATDVGGYFAGTAFGRHKIWPRVSPKKSWEGSLAGMAGSIVVCLIFGAIEIQNERLLPQLPFFSWIFIGILLNVAAQLGDFFESALKRTLDIKDSGTILPGHGGILDRIDSLLFTLIAYTTIRLMHDLLPQATPAL